LGALDTTTDDTDDALDKRQLMQTALFADLSS